MVSNSYLDNAWLNIGDIDKINIDKNVMINRSETDIENPDRHLVNIIKDPANFSMTAKLLMDIELHPIQAAILEEFWDRPFPMFIASRGFGKSFLLESILHTLKCIFVPGSKIVVVGAAFRQSKIIFEYMENMWRTSPIIRSIFNGNDDGPRRDVDRCTMRLWR